MFRHLALLVFGVFACSTAVLLLKASGMHAIELSAWRLLIAAVLLTPLFVRDLRRHGWTLGRREFRRTLLPGAVLGLHFITWIAGARMTLSANASLVVNMVPLIMPLLLWWMLRERLSRGEWAGTAMAMGGLAVLTLADYHLSPEHFVGDLVCFGSMLLFAVYLALGRFNRTFPSIWLYLVPLYFVGGVVCLVAYLPLGNPFVAPSRWDLLMALGLGIIPTIIGHSTLNYAMKHLRGQFVGIANVGQFVFAGILAFFLRNEVPEWQFYASAALVVIGAYLAVRPSRAPVPGPQPAAMPQAAE